MLHLAVVALSTLIQAAAGILALRLIAATQRRLPWVLLALGLWGMALRRAMSLGHDLTHGVIPPTLSLPYELLGLATSLFMLSGLWFVRPFFLELNQARERAERDAAIKATLAAELQAALDNVKVLSGFLPICSSCKRIRNEKGDWDSLEGYIHTRTDAEFSHGICPQCLERLYPEFAGKEE